MISESARDISHFHIFERLKSINTLHNNDALWCIINLKPTFLPDFWFLKENGSSLLCPIRLLIYGLDNNHPTCQADNSNRFPYLLQQFFRIVLLPYCQDQTSCSLPVSQLCTFSIEQIQRLPQNSAHLREILRNAFWAADSPVLS